jgi:hypothetical protein
MLFCNVHLPESVDQFYIEQLRIINEKNHGKGNTPDIAGRTFKYAVNRLFLFPGKG